MTSAKHNRTPKGEPVPESTVSTSPGLKLLLIIFGISCALGAGEIAIRWFELGPELSVVDKRNFRLSSDPILKYELLPGSGDGDFRISEAGLRDKDFSLQKPPGTFRILIIGDSIAYGYGVKQNQTFSAQFENLLATYWPHEDLRFEVLNLGVTGYSIDQVLENLQVRGLQFDPDLIIYAYCLNDPIVYSFEYENLKAQLSNPDTNYRDELLQRGDSLAGNLRIYLLTKYALRALRSEWFSDANLKDDQWAAISDGSYGQFFSEAYAKPESEDRLRSGVETLQKISQSTGVPVVTIIFPIFYDLGEYRVKQLHELVTELHVEFGVRIYDLLELYSNMYASEGRVFVHNALHPNTVGHRLGALYVLRRLLDNDLLPLSTGWAGQPTESDHAIAKVVDQTLNKSQ